MSLFEFIVTLEDPASLILIAGTMVAASATADRKVLAHLSKRVVTLCQCFSLPNMISMRLRRRWRRLW